MKNYAFIFARGGSKGLPEKNIKPLMGKPLLEYSIDIANACSSIDKVFLSTDDKAIAEVGSSCGAIVIDRPKELSGDKSPEWLAWRHAIAWVEERFGNFDGFISLPATSPLRAIEDVETAISERLNKNADVCISVTPASRSPYFNMVHIQESGEVKLVNSIEGEVYRRQDSPLVYDITTVVYVLTPTFIKENKSLFSGRVTSVEVPKERAVDIDDIYDFRLAEAIMMESL